MILAGKYMQGKLQQAQNFRVALGALLASAVFVNAARSVSQLLREPDMWWHIKTGQMILASGSVPQVDSFSHSFFGSPWIAKEWLSQVIYALCYNMAHWAGLLFFASCVLALTAWLMYQFLTRSLQPFYAVFLVLLLLLMVQGVTVARPHLLTFPIAVTLTWFMFDASRRGTRPPFWCLALVVLWANLHSSFPISFLITGTAFLDYFQRSGFKLTGHLKIWVVFLGLCPIISLINPYFYQPYLLAIKLAQGIDVMGQISEWAPFTAPENRHMEIGLLAILFFILWSRAKLTIGQVIFVLATLHMMLDHLRFQYLFFLLVPLAVMPEIVLARPELSTLKWQEKQLDGFQVLISKAMNVVFAGSVMAAVLAAGLLDMRNMVEPPESASLSNAIAYVKEHSANDPALQMKVFNEYNFGGPLILADVKTYIDGRAEQLFLGPFMTNYLASGQPGNSSAINKILEDPEIGWTIFPSGDPRNAALSQLPNWKKVYGDNYALIYERKLGH
jgi:hypothetical protein